MEPLAMDPQSRNVPIPAPVDDGAPPFVDIVTFDVSCFPLDHEDRRNFNVTVEYRGRGMWAVKHHMMCLGADGEWDYESSPGNREDEWIASHRFTMQEAIRRAREIAPKLTVNGWTVRDVMLKREHPTGGRHA